MDYSPVKQNQQNNLSIYILSIYFKELAYETVGLASVPTHQEVTQKESIYHNFIYSLSFASNSWKFLYPTCPNEQSVFSMPGVQMQDESGHLDMYQGSFVI